MWQFYLTCFVLGLVGNGAAHLAYSRSISTWFQRRLGLRSFSNLYGLTWSFYAVAGAMGPAMLGRAFDATGSYSSLLVLLAVALALAAATNLLFPRYEDSADFAVDSGVLR